MFNKKCKWRLLFHQYITGNAQQNEDYTRTAYLPQSEYGKSNYGFNAQKDGEMINGMVHEAWAENNLRAYMEQNKDTIGLDYDKYIEDTNTHVQSKNLSNAERISYKKTTEMNTFAHQKLFTNDMVSNEDKQKFFGTADNLEQTARLLRKHYG